MTNNLPEKNNPPAWLGQVQQFTTGAAPDATDAVTDPASVGAALGAIAAAMPPAEPTLGDRLRAINLSEREAAAQANLAAVNEMTRAQQVRVQATQEFFSRAWAKFSQNLLAGRNPGEVTLGNGHNPECAEMLAIWTWHLPRDNRWQSGGKGIWSQTHPLHAPWAEFLEKCKENGLEPYWLYDYDGAGINSWWVLMVKPADKEV